MDFELTTELLISCTFDVLMIAIFIFMGFKMEKLTSYTKKLLDIMEKREHENINNKNDQK